MSCLEGLKRFCSVEGCEGISDSMDTLTTLEIEEFETPVPKWIGQVVKRFWEVGAAPIVPRKVIAGVSIDKVETAIKLQGKLLLETTDASEESDDKYIIEMKQVEVQLERGNITTGNVESRIAQGGTMKIPEDFKPPKSMGYHYVTVEETAL